MLGALSMPGRSARAALITGSYQLDYNQDVTTKEDAATGGITKEDVRKFKQTLELKYRGFLSPVVENELTFKAEQEVNSNAADTTRLLPTLDLGLKGRFWDLKAGGKRTHENSDEPEKNPKTTDSWFVELFYQAPRRVPDLKAKYTLDTDFEEGATDTEKEGINLSSVYKPNDWLDAKAEYTRDTTDDKMNADSDTKDDKRSATLGIRRMISPAIKAEAEYSVEESRGATHLDNGATTNDKRDQTHKVKTLLAFKPFRDTSLDGSYDYELKQNMVLGEHTLTTHIKGTAGQKILKPVDVKGELRRDITEARHTEDDNTKTEDVWKVDVKLAFSKLLDFSVSREDKNTVEEHVDASKNKTTGTVSDKATWTGEMTPFWKASVSYDRVDTFDWDPVDLREVKTTIDTKYGLKSTFDFKAINLTLDPTYDIAFKDDRLKPEKTETRDFKFKFAYKILSTRAIEAKLDHTYGRKKDTSAGNIERTDNSTGNVTWKDPLPGMGVAFDFTRQATDKSGDDSPPDITSTYGFKIDYRYQWLAMNVSYKYDKKLPEETTDNSETFDAKAGWTAPRWDVSLTYNFTKTFSEALDEKYSLTLTFKYNL